MRTLTRSQHAVPTGFSRRSILGRLGAGGAAAGVIGAFGLGQRHTVAQGTTTEHLELDFTPHDAVSITLAGDGPPQRGDWFYVDAPVYAAGDVNGTRIGTYECFGAWVAAADDTEAVAQRLTTVHFRLDDGSIMGVINEFGTGDHVGAVQGGTGRYAGALGTFQQLDGPSAPPATPGAPAASPAAGTPLPDQFVVRAVFELMLPNAST